MVRALFAVFLAAGLVGCGAPRIPGITPYRPEIQQGNFVSQEMMAQVPDQAFANWQNTYLCI